MPLKNPDAIAAVVAALRLVYGDDDARTMLVEGMTLAALIDAMFAGPIPHRDAVRNITNAIYDFSITPDLGPIWHLRYVYDQQPGAFRVVDMEIATPSGKLASKDIWLRLPV